MANFDSIFLIFLILFLIGVVVLIALALSQKKDFNSFLNQTLSYRDRLEQKLKDFHKENKDDYQRAQNSHREELSANIKAFNDSFKTGVGLLSENQKNQLENLQKSQEKRLESIEKSQQERLDEIRKTVEEKLDKTLADRLGKSFETVSKQLEGVQKGLGEMKNLADDVGGLKKVLSNVKMRGGVGEMQLKMLLEQYLAPGQYEANVKTKKGSNDNVEFAIKFPGADGKHVWLPIDSKFPQDKYEHLVNAYDLGDKEQIELCRKDLESAIKKNAKDISDKYLDVPNTTRFAIMFLPFEGLYAEVVRNNILLDQIQKSYNVSVAGPTNLAALLTSFQLGFQTLAIQKRGDEVWKTLGAVKAEFEQFGGMLEKAKGKIEGGLRDIDKLMTTRTNVINRKLKDVAVLDSSEEFLNISHQVE